MALFIECHYDECRNLCTVMLSVVMLNVVMLNVVAPVFQLNLGFSDKGRSSFSSQCSKILGSAKKSHQGATL